MDSRLLRSLRIIVEEPLRNYYGARFFSRNLSFDLETVPCGSEVLIETGDWMYSNYVAMSEVIKAQYLTRGPALVGYSVPRFGLRSSHWIDRLKTDLLRRDAVPRSLGIEKWIEDFDPLLIGDVDIDTAQALINKLNSKEELERLELFGVWVGDLLYDDFLAISGLPTIELDAVEFRMYLPYFVALVRTWIEYFNTHNVSAVFVSHACYRMGIPARIALINGIPAFSINIFGLFRLSQRFITSNLQFWEYPELFSAMSAEDQQHAREEAEKRIQLRMSGEVGVDMPYASASAFGPSSDSVHVQQTSRIKVLILTHCFFDNPHPYGLNFYPDVYEWLCALGRLSERSDYDWYLKTHPDPRQGTTAIIQSVVDNFPQIRLLPSDASHNQLVAEGIDVALTMWGTAGWEYPYLGVPVIMASQNQPYVRYGFSVTPHSREHYEALIGDLGQFLMEINIPRDEILEFYYMHHLARSISWVVPDYAQWEIDIGGYMNNFTPKVYSNWRKRVVSGKVHDLIARIQWFMDHPGHYRLNMVE